MPPSEIERDIYNTLAYFAYSQYPLTIFELYKWQYEPARIYSYKELEQSLQSSLWLKKRIGYFEGMYAIGTDSEVEQQVRARKRCFLHSAHKQRKAQKVVKYLSFLPAVQGVAICNSLAIHFAREKSDIDLFVLTKAGRVWTARMWCVFPFFILRQRPGETKKHPIDMSFFVSEQAMDLSSLQRKESDPYLAFWIKILSPVYGAEKLWNAFFEKNTWANNYFPNAHRTRRPERMQWKTRRSIFPCIIPEFFMRCIQLAKLPMHIKSRCGKGSCVVINDQMLKFHTVDRRQEIAQAFERKCV